ncbi:hypothetical protein B0X71_15575 [Planococcus lenghuensis]|uniref:HTH merR-type domain-containing protein n=1 Tax=Planococcus lenghuensis TaxID=2213202 RepID=A0A1Q2L414_9BACL|nr:hypothetical protein B0X71_15575 [Planococcus lenghuensis]
MYKVQEAAKMAGISVRTLHHYDHIDLLKPSDVGENRYRYYSDEDLKSLQHILLFKELGFPLKKIQEIVSSGFDRDHALTQHAELLQLKKQRIERLLETIEQTRSELQGITVLSHDERFSAFAADTAKMSLERYIKEEPPAQAAEAKDPTADQTGTDDVGETADRIYRSIAGRMHLPPDHPDVQQDVDDYFVLLNRSFDCTPAVFRRLGDLYVNDSRYTASIDRHKEGLAAYLREAMLSYAGRLHYA